MLDRPLPGNLYLYSLFKHEYSRRAEHGVGTGHHPTALVSPVSVCRLLRELLTNVVKHAWANKVAVHLGLQKLLQLNQANHNVLQSISISSLLAVAHYKLGRMDEALKATEQALDLANSSDIIQPFVEPIPPMADLLKQLRKRTAAVDYIEKILSAFPDFRSGA
jgi:tetratricopeptide (TPR) repeat protein